jgi:hypothetical protein
LERWRGVSVYSADVPTTCEHCGTGISNVVVARNFDSGQTWKIGTTCAERLGLTKAQVRQLYDERRMSEQRERWSTMRAEDRAKEAEIAAELGEHGTQQRFDNECRCRDCVPFAAHGTLEQFEATSCSCVACRDAVRGAPPYESITRTMLVDADTRRPVDGARVVSTRYGSSWLIPQPAVDDDDDDGFGRSMSGEPSWVSAHPARRSTMAKKGYLEVEVDWIGIRGRNGVFPLVRDGDPTVDAWGESIEVVFDD